MGNDVVTKKVTDTQVHYINFTGRRAAAALRALRARLAAATSSEEAASDEQSDDDDEKSGARAHGARAHAHGALRALKVLLAPGTAPNTSKAD